MDSEGGEGDDREVGIGRGCAKAGRVWSDSLKILSQYVCR